MYIVFLVVQISHLEKQIIYRDFPLNHLISLENLLFLEFLLLIARILFPIFHLFRKLILNPMLNLLALLPSSEFLLSFQSLEQSSLKITSTLSIITPVKFIPALCHDYT